MELSDIQNQQAQKAQQMRNNMQGLQKEQQSQIQNRGREELARNVSGIRKDYSNRGLLYSGLRRGAESGAAGNIAASGAQQQAQSNLGLQNELQGLDQNAIQTGLQQQQISQQENDNAYQRALQERQQKQSLGGVISGAASRLF